jgi:hypothetical protein
MNKAPHNRGASEKNTFFSTRKKVSSSEAIINLIALNTLEDDSEAPEIRKRRREMESAQKTLEHFRHLGLTPIFTPCDYEALRARGER